MNNQLTVFWIICVLNICVVAVYLVWNVMNREENRTSCIIRSLVMVLCPVVGPLFFAFSFLIYKLFLSDPVDLADVVFSKDRVKTYVHPDEERERNIVSLEEAIEIMDKENLRGVMMNVIRTDFQKSLTGISLALNSEDTETAHYAASVLQDALNQFNANVDMQYAFIFSDEDNPDKVDCAIDLLDYMNQVLKQKVFTPIEQKSLTVKMEQVGEFVYQNKNKLLTAEIYEKLCLRLLEVKEFDLCTKWCNRSIEQYPDMLSTYTCQLKLYFASEQKERFFEVMDDLKKSAVVVDKETLELLRVFSEG